ncbi:alpha/beta hydrolase [Geodermatophilus sp. SYSU D00758]
MSAPLTEVAGWDVPLVRGAVWTLSAVADRLPAWRGRTEAVGRALGDTDCWYGPAGTAAGAALTEVSTVLMAVTGALTGSLDQARALLAAATTAQDLAARALATAASVPVRLDDAGRLVDLGPAAGAIGGGAGADPLVPGLDVEDTTTALRAQQLAEEALEAAARAVLAAAAAADALAATGVGPSGGPVGFPALSGLVGAPPAPHPTLLLGAPPGQVAAWWAGLSTTQRERAIQRTPVLVGSLDGVPAWARDEANRRLLDSVLADPAAPGHAVASAVAREVAAREDAGQQVQLWQFRPAEELVALGLGDLDTADVVGVLVPGVGNDPAGDLGELARDAAAIGDAALAAAPGLAVATVAWLGYRPPSVLGAPLPGASWHGGRGLDAALDGLAATRPDRPGRVTVVAHSYGTVVVDRAADEPGLLAADAVVLLGSPGVDNDAAGLEAPEVYESSSPADPITWLADWFGTETDNPRVGAEPLPTGWTTGHTGYLDPDGRTLPAVGEVVAGQR